MYSPNFRLNSQLLCIAVISFMFISTPSFSFAQQSTTGYQEPSLGFELLDLEVLPSNDRFPTKCDFVASHPKDPYNFSDIEPTYTEYLNPLEAIPACEAAFADRPDLRNAYLLGRSYDRGGLYDKAFVYLKAAAEQDYRIAQNHLGVLYQHGQGVPQDLTKAAYWFRLSANQGDQIAQTNLGFLYREGLGVPQDMKQALYWFELSSQGKNWYAQYNMGYMYLNGFGVEQNYDTAYSWFYKSAQQNYIHALFQLGEMHRLGLYGGKPDSSRAIYWYKLAADKGHTEAIHWVSEFVERFE